MRYGQVITPADDSVFVLENVARAAVTSCLERAFGEEEWRRVRQRMVDLALLLRSWHPAEELEGPAIGVSALGGAGEENSRTKRLE